MYHSPQHPVVCLRPGRVATVTGPACLLLAASALVGAAPGRPQMAPATQATRPAATQPAVVDYQPGVRINWKDRQVEVAGMVNMRAGGIELFACSPRTREHESILCIDARPLHVYQALGLIGLTPGHPMRFDPQTRQVEPATGEPVEIEVEYTLDGRLHREPIERWMRRAADTRNPTANRDLTPLPWVFAGSFLTPDGAFAADFEGTVIAVVNFESSLIALPEFHSDSNDELWLEPATERIPPLQTRCTLLFRPGPIPLTLDADGRIRLAGRQCILADLARQLRELRKADPGPRVRLGVDPKCPPETREAVERLLGLLGIPGATATRPSGASSLRPEPTLPALAAWVRDNLLSDSTGQTSQPPRRESSRTVAGDLLAHARMVRDQARDTAGSLQAVIRDLDVLLSPSAAMSQPATSDR
jgi:hypothetical protein